LLPYLKNSCLPLEHLHSLIKIFTLFKWKKNGSILKVLQLIRLHGPIYCLKFQNVMLVLSIHTVLIKAILDMENGWWNRIIEKKLSVTWEKSHEWYKYYKLYNYYWGFRISWRFYATIKHMKHKYELRIAHKQVIYIKEWFTFSWSAEKK
jgi:hypothetical protein